MEKLLSVAIPCYNSQDYMRHCVETLVSGGEQMDIMIIDDGSKDRTLDIARELESAYPGIVRAIHQENKGHGGAVMTGIHNALAPYFKVVDSDDWVDEKALSQILKLLSLFHDEGDSVDMMISNFVYDKVGSIHKKVMKYTFALPAGKKIGWDDARRFRKGQYILMHSVIYRTAVLVQSGLELPTHTFYVDNLFVYTPLPYVKTMYYLPVNFYHYFIGRDDQSVQESVMISRIDQQIRVNKLMLMGTDLRKVRDINKHLCQYMYNYMEIITVVSSILLIKSGTPENLRKKKELWGWIRSEYPWFYKRIRRGFFGNFLAMPGRAGRRIQIILYYAAQKLFGFN
ncbi:glycosyltransferase family 2 protein [Butyrivibrio sp. MC2013]|uniref:glycosyltransferase family 2 protein n=1 Tax=Butyrivibrio sp. MC2013 TaxID=1280686 RepID=UPI00040E77A6|nr:glycosyltransferase family 2 protein [Butyrivibrio sp. MC2013]